MSLLLMLSANAFVRLFDDPHILLIGPHCPKQPQCGSRVTVFDFAADKIIIIYYIYIQVVSCVRIYRARVSLHPHTRPCIQSPVSNFHHLHHQLLFINVSQASERNSVYCIATTTTTTITSRLPRRNLLVLDECPGYASTTRQQPTNTQHTFHQSLLLLLLRKYYYYYNYN